MYPCVCLYLYLRDTLRTVPHNNTHILYINRRKRQKHEKEKENERKRTNEKSRKANKKNRKSTGNSNSR